MAGTDPATKQGEKKEAEIGAEEKIRGGPDELDGFWLLGGSCDGYSIVTTGATKPGEEPSTESDGAAETAPGAEGGKSPTPEAIEAQIRAAGGQLEQRTLCAWAECSDTLISRRLSSMEEEGRITRIRFGRTKLVYLPNNVPDLYGTPEGQEPDKYAGL